MRGFWYKNSLYKNNVSLSELWVIGVVHNVNRMGQITFQKFEIERRLLKLLLLKESPQKQNSEPQPQNFRRKSITLKPRDYTNMRRTIVMLQKKPVNSATSKQIVERVTDFSCILTAIAAHVVKNQLAVTDAAMYRLLWYNR